MIRSRLQTRVSIVSTPVGTPQIHGEASAAIQSHEFEAQQSITRRAAGESKPRGAEA